VSAELNEQESSLYQLTVTVSTLDHLYERAGYLAEPDFLSQLAVPQRITGPQLARQTEASAQDRSQPTSDSDHRPATDRHINYLNDLASKAGWKLHVFEDAVVSLNGPDDFAHLTKSMASDLITRLQNNDFHPQPQG
jgi:hypothetical protein